MSKKVVETKVGLTANDIADADAQTLALLQSAAETHGMDEVDMAQKLLRNLMVWCGSYNLRVLVVSELNDGDTAMHSSHVCPSFFASAVEFIANIHNDLIARGVECPDLADDIEIPAGSLMQ